MFIRSGVFAILFRNSFDFNGPRIPLRPELAAFQLAMMWIVQVKIRTEDRSTRL